MYSRNEIILQETEVNDHRMFIFSGEVTPASTFMSGKVKVMGDLSKALKLEEVLRAAREADERKAAKNA